MSAAIVLPVAWLIGAAVTYAVRVREVSTDSPLVGFGIALLVWPAFWVGRR